MAGAINRTARAVTENTMLTALSRVAVAIALPALGFGFTLLIDVDKRLGVVESGRIQGREEIVRRIDDVSKRAEALEARDREDARTNADIIAKIAAVQADQVWIKRSLDRVEAALNTKGKP